MRAFRFTMIAAFLFGFNSAAWAQTWDPNKVWYAGDPGSPNTLRYIDVDGSFPGWLPNDQGGTITHLAPSANPGGIAGVEGSYFSVVAGKEKHLTNNWPALDGNGSTRTALFWRIYIPSSPAVSRFPSIQFRTHGERHHLDFSPTASGGGTPKPGWVSAEDTNFVSGGLIKNDGSGQRYLPMSMDAWHTIRVETTGATGQFAIWIDEEEGLSDVKRINAVATKDGTGNYIEIGVRSSPHSTQVWTNYLAWGQDTTATGGTNQIAPLMSPSLLVEDCDNSTDDDGDGLADCADPGCLCAPVPEDNFAACHNEVDDDQDGLIDCDDPDCAGAAAENTTDACSNQIDDDCDGLTDCDDPDCAIVAGESSQSGCTNARDDDCDGLVDCLDPDCSFMAECDPDEPHYVLTIVRQIGTWQNNCDSNGFCGHVLFSSVYDEFGNPLDGVRIGDPVRGVDMVTLQDPNSAPDGQHGHGRYEVLSPNLSGAYRLRVIDESGTPVSSDTTPFFYATPEASATTGPFYSWQVEFMRKTKRTNPGTFTPEDPCYIFDGVEMNPPAGVNNTLVEDDSDLYTGGDGFVQTFVPDGNRVVSARFELSTGLTPTGQQRKLRYQTSIHSLLNDPPTSLADLGPQIGATKMGPADMIESEFWRQMLVWPVDENDPDAVVVSPGVKYAALITRADPGGDLYPWFNAWITEGNYYPNGQAYRQPLGTSDLVSDSASYDITGYIVCATIGKCVNSPVFDVAGGGTQGDESDGQVNSLDFEAFRQCATGPTPDPTLFDEEHVNYIGDPCACMDTNDDLALDQLDFAAFQRCLGLTGSALASCDEQ